MLNQIYLDNSATTKPCTAAVEATAMAMTEFYGNPSSTHKMGVDAAHKLSKAREAVSKALNVSPETLVFTSGGTAADNLAILGGTNIHKGKHIVTTAIEHPAVLNSFKELERQGFEATYVMPDKYGNVSLGAIESALRADTSFVSVMHVNNETGAVMPITEIKAVMNRICPDALFHCDAVQSFGKTDLFPENYGIDLVSVSAHKIHGTKGSGALYVKKGINLKPTMFGGGQERKLYPGTENTPSIMAFAAACNEISIKDREKVKTLSDLLKDGIRKIDGCHINSPDNGLPYIINASFDKIPSEVLLNALSGEGVMISAGSACSSSKAGKSHVLAAMGAETAKSAVRFSLSKQNTEEEIETTVKILSKIVPMLIIATGGRK